MVVAGFSCQPWSKLGDGKRFDDARSSSLLFVLRYAFFSRAHSLMLECVQEAGKDVEVQKVLQEFCKITGFKMKTVNLHLESFWPSKRGRWWCMLVNPAFPMDDLRPLPVQRKTPVVSSLFPYFPTWSSDEEEQLALDLYETNKFIEFNSFDNAVIKGDMPLNTALHGWGNQLQGCPCGCRKFSMDHNRLRTKGLYAALVIMEGCIESVDGPRVRSRHIHPFELSVLTGAYPGKKWLPNLRLCLCGLGQMASPIQSAWVYGQFRFSIGKFFGWENVATPEMVLWNHVEKVLDSFQKAFPMILEHESVAQFISDTHDLLFCGHMDRIVPSAISRDDNLVEIKDHLEVCNTEVPEANHDHAIPLTDDGYLAIDENDEEEPWNCPFNDCFICKPVQIEPFTLDNRSSQEFPAISLTLPFSVRESASPAENSQNRVVCLTTLKVELLLFPGKDHMMKPFFPGVTQVETLLVRMIPNCHLTSQNQSMMVLNPLVEMLNSKDRVWTIPRLFHHLTFHLGNPSPKVLWPTFGMLKRSLMLDLMQCKGLLHIRARLIRIISRRSFSLMKLDLHLCK